jgi:hypothetical protein
MECVICTEILSSNDVPREECGHTFHLSCLQNMYEAKCPLCRTPLLNLEVREKPVDYYNEINNIDFENENYGDNNNYNSGSESESGSDSENEESRIEEDSGIEESKDEESDSSSDEGNDNIINNNKYAINEIKSILCELYKYNNTYEVPHEFMEQDIQFIESVLEDIEDEHYVEEGSMDTTIKACREALLRAVKNDSSAHDKKTYSEHSSSRYNNYNNYNDYNDYNNSHYPENYLF